MSTPVPLPTGILGDPDIPELQEFLVNLYNPGDNTILKGPGVDAFSTGVGNCRGTINFKGSHYQVSGNNLIRVNEDGSTVVIGIIDGTADVDMAVTFVALNIVVKGGVGYSFTLGGGLVVMGGAFAASVEITAINQRFVYVPTDGGPLFYTDVNVPETIPAANFFDAELLPDENRGVINLRNDLYVGGDDTFEVFRDQGTTDNPFQRIDRAAIETGYITAKAVYKDTFVFLGKDREGAFAFHIMGAGDAPKISNPAIESILNEEYTPTELVDCTSKRFTWKGIDMVSFRLARHDFLFFGSGWSFMQSGIDGLGVVQTWDIKFMSFSYGKYITGNAGDASIGKLSLANTEFGNKIERGFDTFIKAQPDTYFSINEIFLKCITGTALVEGTISLQVSKDSLTFGPQVPRGLAAEGKTQQQMAWRGGAGVFESFAGLRFRTTADVNFSTEGLTFNGE